MLQRAGWTCVWLCLAAAGRAQSGFGACRPAPALSVELDAAAAAAHNPQLDLDARLAPYRTLIASYPESVR